MDSPPPPPPPLFGPDTGVPPPQPQRRSLTWLWIVLAVLVIVVGGLAMLALPTYRKIEKMAQEKREQRLEALKPRLPLSDDEKAAVDKFGRELAEAVKAGEAEKVAAMVDLEGMTDRVFLSLGEGRLIADARKGFKKGYESRPGGLFKDVLGQNARYLRFAERDGFPVVRLRIIFADGAINFMDALVRVSKDGSVKAVDIYTFVFGSFASAEGRNAIATMLGGDLGGPMAKFLGIPDNDEASLKQSQAMSNAWRDGNVETVVRLYDELPQEKQKQRLFFLLYLQALLRQDTSQPAVGKRYREALADAATVLGPDSTTDLLMVDLKFLEGDWAGVDECLRKTEAVVGRDAYLTYLRALMLLRQNKPDEAKRLEQEATEMEPEMLDLVDLRLMIGAARKDYAGMVAVLKDFKANHDGLITREQLAEDEQYADFLKSPEFAKWEAANR